MGKTFSFMLTNFTKDLARFRIRGQVDSLDHVDRDFLAPFFAGTTICAGMDEDPEAAYDETDDLVCLAPLGRLVSRACEVTFKSGSAGQSGVCSECRATSLFKRFAASRRKGNSGRATTTEHPTRSRSAATTTTTVTTGDAVPLTVEPELKIKNEIIDDEYDDEDDDEDDDKDPTYDPFEDAGGGGGGSRGGAALIKHEEVHYEDYYFPEAEEYEVEEAKPRQKRLRRAGPALPKVDKKEILDCDLCGFRTNRTNLLVHKWKKHCWRERLVCLHCR